MSTPSASRFFSRPVITGLAVFIALTLLTQAVTYQRQLLFKETRTRELTNAANVAKEKLQSALSYSLSATQTLSFIVTKYGVKNDFAEIAKRILDNSKFIDAIELTRGGNITNIYPLEGNEAAIGYDILKDSLRREEGYKTIERKELFFAGPFKLKQGYTGIVGRLPIFINEEFVGFSVVIIKLPTLIAAAEIDTGQNRNYIFQLSKINPDTHREEFFLPNPELFQNGNAVSVQVPMGEWKIYVRSAHSQVFISPLPFAIIGFLLALLGAVFAWYITAQPYELKKMVDEQTKYIIQEKRFSDSIINNLPGIFYVGDIHRNMIKWNKNLEIVTGYTANEISKMQTTDFIDPGQMDYALNKRQESLASGKAEAEISIINKEGVILTYFITIMPIHYNEQPCILGMGIDVTQRKRIEKEIIASEEKLRNTLDNMIEAVQIIGFDWQYIYVNKAAVEQNRMVGREKLLGHTMLEIYPGMEMHEAFQSLKRSLEERIPVETETEFIFPDGTARWYQLSIQPVPEGIFILSIDITQRKKAEVEILHEKVLSESIINSLPGIFYLADIDGRLMRWNKNFETVSGYTATQLASMRILDFIDIDEQEAMLLQKQKAIETGIAETELSFVTKSKQKPLYYITALATLYNGKPALLGIGIDISQRKKAEQAAIESEEQYRSLIENLPDIIMRLDLDERVQFINYVAGGYTREQIIGSSAYNFVMPEFHDLVKAAHKKVLDTRESQTYETVSLGEDGIKRWFLTNVGPIVINGKVTGITLITRDITERKRVELRLQETTRQLQYIFNVLDNSFWGADLVNNKMLYVSTGTERIYGYTEAEFMSNGNLWSEVVVPEDRHIAFEAFPNLRNGNSVVFENRIKHKNGSIRWVEARIVPTLDVNGELIRLDGITLDISDRKNVEEALKNSEEKYRYLFHNNPALIIIWDLENLTIMEVNDQVTQLYGYTKDELLGMSVLKLRPEDDYQQIKDFAKTMEEGEKRQLRRTWRHLKKNGELMYMDITSHHINYNGRKAILSLGKDITDQYKMEEELKATYEDIRRLNAHLQSIREEERASIAREIHDELGQQLTGIKMDISWLNKRLPETDTSVADKAKEIISLIDETVKTVRRISSDLRPGILDDLGLIAALEWQSSEFQKRSGITCNFVSNIEEFDCEKNIATGIFRIYQEALTNVIRHAEATLVESSLEQTEEHIILTVKDNGKGFDTSEAKNGKTLGLVGMHERAVLFGGELRIESAKGSGTMITLKIPLTKLA